MPAIDAKLYSGRELPLQAVNGKLVTGDCWLSAQGRAQGELPRMIALDHTLGLARS
jgi:hypothetical protein